MLIALEAAEVVAGVLAEAAVAEAMTLMPVLRLPAPALAFSEVLAPMVDKLAWLRPMPPAQAAVFSQPAMDKSLEEPRFLAEALQEAAAAVLWEAVGHFSGLRVMPLWAQYRLAI